MKNDIPFISSPIKDYYQGDIVRLGLYLQHQYRNFVDTQRPFLIPSYARLAPLFIASCWKFGIPFWIVPDDWERVIPGEIIKKINPAGTFSDEILDSALKDSAISKVSFPSIPPEAIFGYFLTSGTTGMPKVVALKRRQMEAAATASALNFKPQENEQWLLCLPLNHVGGVSVVLRSLIYGSRVFDARLATTDELCSYLSTPSSISFTSMVPTQLNAMLNAEPGLKVHESFKAILLGGGPADSSLIEKARSNRIPVLRSYGMSETCAQLFAMPLSSVFNEPAESSGLILIGNKVEIRNPDSDGIGELWVKGPQVIDSYFFNENESIVFDDSGWFLTGDFARLDDSNRIFIEMRREDRIVTGGENVNPAEVEQAIQSYFGIDEAVVIGLPDNHWGQIVVAVVTDDSVTLSKISERLKPHLESYKIPKKIVTVSTIPRNEMGKVMRKELLSMIGW